MSQSPSGRCNASATTTIDVEIFSKSGPAENDFLSLLSEKPEGQACFDGWGPMKLTNFLKRLGSDNFGATAIEYGLIVSLVVIACIGAFEAVANENTGLWATVTEKVTTVM